MSDLRVDHVIYAVDDLEVAARHFYAEFGLGSVEGGRHPGWGTANRIVPLGNSYLELVTVIDPDEAASSDFGRAVSEAIAAREPLVGWVVATDDVGAFARRLRLEVSRGSRTRPDGTTLSWQLAGLTSSLKTGALPLFIEWGGPSALHPGKAQAQHRLKPRGFAWVEVAADEQAVRSWLGDFEFELRIVNGAPGLSAVAISTAAGELVLR
jgi:Glyoxalase-like domain